MGAKEYLENAERRPDFANRVEGVSRASRNVGKKRFAPLTFLLFLVLGGGTLFLGGQSVLGAHISNLFTEATDVQFTSYSLRNQRIFSYILDGSNRTSSTSPFSKLFVLSPWMEKRLANNGIEVIDTNGSRALRYNGETITAAEFTAKYAQDLNFREAYYKAKRGRVAGFFDDSSERIYSKLGLSRNIFADFKSSNDSATNTVEAKKILSDQIKGNVEIHTNSAGHKTDDDGNTYIGANGENVDTRNIPGDTPQSKAREYATRLTGKVSNAAGGFCAAVQVAQLANLTYFVAYTSNAINYAMGLNENISKMLAGQGNESAFNEVMNFLTATTTSEVVSVDDSGNTTVDTVTGSMLQAPVPRLVLGGLVPAQHTTGSFSLESIINTTQRAVLFHGGSSIACSTLQASSAIISLVSAGVPGGILARAVVGMLAETVGGIAITGAMSSVMSIIIPGLATTLFSDVVETHTGISAGNLYGTGIAAANFRVAQSASALTPASAEVIMANARATSSVLAQEAELDRRNRSPFDVSSSNTFLGSLFAGFLPLLASSSPTSPLSTLSSLTSSSINRLLPSAFAESVEPTYTTTFGDCPTLEKIGAKGTVDCLAIPAFDSSTIDISPIPGDPNYDPNYEAVIMQNMSADASTIIDNSELAKFITFCTERESPWGVTDANILNALQTDYGVILNNLPFLNDVVSLVNAAEDTINGPWATGEICINSPDNPRWDDEFKYYYRFVEDARILGQMGAYENTSNPVLGFLDRYYTQHPLDNSPEGYLARITGMTTSDIAFLLEFVDYSNFLADYDPTDLYPVPAQHTQISLTDTISRTVLVARTVPEISGPAAYPLAYADTRTRSYAI